jgi:hypothetical protein
LSNVSLLLLEGCTLLAGLNHIDVYLYYEYTKVLVYANHHTIRVIIDVSLKSFDRYYSLYKLITLPTKIANFSNYVLIETDFPYFMLENAKQHYLRVSEEEIQKGKGNAFAICPVDQAVLNTTVKTCESSFYFQNVEEARALFKRQMMTPDYASLFLQHGPDWIFSLLSKQLVNFKCQTNRIWTTLSLHNQGNGIIHNASSCHVIGENFQLYPTVRGKTISDLQHHDQYLSFT